MKGTYILEIHIRKNIKLSIGLLGLIYFKKGFYYYIGSAMGSKGSSTLINRVKRHLKNSNEKKKFWHIDYLLENENALITRIILIPCIIKLECEFANYFFQFADNHIRNFGSSDCLCKSHLFYFKNHSQKFI
jgi:Uri superfamily endonuclease